LIDNFGVQASGRGDPERSGVGVMLARLGERAT
jgi:hypothetical protein